MVISSSFSAVPGLIDRSWMRPDPFPPAVAGRVRVAHRRIDMKKPTHQEKSPKLELKLRGLKTLSDGKLKFVLGGAGSHRPIEYTL
jgi:hypothetical protein